MSEIKIEANKIKIPLITEEDIKSIDNNLNSIIEEFIELRIKDKDLALSQYIIQKQQKENKKYKEVINKAIKYIEENKQHEYRNGNFNEYYLELNEKEMTELLDILKEVEHE